MFHPFELRLVTKLDYITCLDMGVLAQSTRLNQMLHRFPVEDVGKCMVSLLESVAEGATDI